MEITGVLDHAGGLNDTLAGRRSYRAYLDWLRTGKRQGHPKSSGQVQRIKVDVPKKGRLGQSSASG
jgi:hypothetical protein